MNVLQDLMNKRAAAYAQGKEILARAEAEKRENTAEENRQIDQHFDLCDKLDADINRHKRSGRFDDMVGGGPPPGYDGRPADDSPEGRAVKAFGDYLRTGDTAELRALGVATGESGGYTAPAEFWKKVTQTLKFYGGIRRRAEVVPTGTGNPLSWPTNNDVSNVGQIVNENAPIPEGDLEFGAKTLYAHNYTSRIIKVSRQMLTDTAIPFEQWLAQRLGQRIGRAQANHWINGTGVAQPDGLLNNLTTGKTTAGAAAITYGELVDLVHSVDIAYREGVEEEPGSGAPAEDCVFVMSDAVLGYLRKLVDSQGLPLIQENARVRGPLTILGHGIVIDNAMPGALATGVKSIAFGNVRAAYVIRDVQGSMTLQRLDERYADYNQVGFIGMQRSDGLVQDPSAMKLLVQA